MDQDLREAALEYHRLPTPGKISVVPTTAMATQRDLALAYSPGVAEPCLVIAKDEHGNEVKIAEGKGDIYPRFGPTNEWDTAAGQGVLEAAGGEVVTTDGRPLLYGKPGFDNPHFIARSKGAKRALLLPVSAPFHSSLLQPAVERLATYLGTVTMNAPRIEVLHNVDVKPAPTAEAIRSALARQAANPVRWVETIEAFVSQGVTHVVECGPGKVLTGLVKRITNDVAAFALNDGDALAAAIAATR